MLKQEELEGYVEWNGFSRKPSGEDTTIKFRQCQEDDLLNTYSELSDQLENKEYMICLNDPNDLVFNGIAHHARFGLERCKNSTKSCHTKEEIDNFIDGMELTLFYNT